MDPVSATGYQRAASSAVSDDGLIEFELPSEAKNIVGRIKSELLEPYWQQIDAADTKLNADKKSIEAQYQNATTAVNEIRTALTDWHNQAIQYLELQKVYHGHAPTVDPHGDSGDWAVATTYANSVKADLDAICRIKKPSLWPINEGTISPYIFLLIGTVCIALCFAPILYLAVMVTLRWYAAFRSERRYQQLQHHRAVAEACLNNCMEQANNNMHNGFQAAVNLHAIEMVRNEILLKPKAAQFYVEFSSFTSRSQYAGAKWDDPVWNTWAPDPSPGFAAQIGQLVLDTRFLKAHLPRLNLDFRLPALVPFTDNRCLLLKAEGVNKDAATKAMQSVMLRMLANTPPGKLRFTFIDPVGIGQNVASFLALGDHDKSLINQKPWTEPGDIEQRLTELTSHMERVISNLLRNKYATLNNYNAEQRAVAEAFRFLVIFDFPCGFSKAAADRLLTIIRNGQRCGVYTLIIRDVSKDEIAPYGFNLNELDKVASIIEWGPQGVTWQDKDLFDAQVLPDLPPGDELFNDIIHKAGTTSKEAMKIEVPFADMLKQAGLDGANIIWKNESSTANDIRVPLGPGKAGQLQYLTLGGNGTTHSGLVIGKPGSGKTKLMHVLITGLALTYPPHEIELYLIDFKGGVGFKPYAQNSLPHAKVIAIQSDREFGLSVLQKLSAEMTRRMDLFRNAGGVESVAAYRNRASADDVLPRILLIADEFQEFFANEDSVAEQARSLLTQLVKQGRQFGIHLILVTQTLAGSDMSRLSSMFGLMGLRIALPCSDVDAEILLPRQKLVASKLTQPGQAIYNGDGGRLEANEDFQVALIGKDDKDKTKENEEIAVYVRGIAKAAAAIDGSNRIPIVFEADEPPNLEQCQPLTQMFQTKSVRPRGRAATIWLGEPLNLSGPIPVLLGHQTDANLMVLNRDESEGMGVLLSAWIALMAQNVPQASQFYLLDFTSPDGPCPPLIDEICERFDFHFIQRLSRPMLRTALQGIVDRIRLRIDGKEDITPTYLIIAGLHRARDLRPTDDGGFPVIGTVRETSLYDLFCSILKDGAEFGIHVLAWCDTHPTAVKTLKRSMANFGLKTSAALSPEESRAFLDVPDAARLEGKQHRMFFVDAVQNAPVQKYRPYRLPDLAWIRQVASQIKGGSS